jgi:hypothetical protein
MSPLWRALAIGLASWVAASVFLRLLGGYVFPVDLIVRAIVFVLTPIIVILVARPLFRLTSFAREHYALAAAAIALPGMILDALVVPNLSLMLPNIDRSLDGALAGLVLLAYSTLLLAGIWFGRPSGAKAPS